MSGKSAGGNTIVVAMIVLGTILLWSGICTLLSVFGEDIAEQPVYWITKLISTVILLCLSCTHIRNGDSERAMLLMVAGLSSMTTFLAWITGDIADSKMLDIPFIPSFVIAAYAAIGKNRKPECAGIVMLIASILLGIVGNDVSESLSGISIIISGGLFLLSGTFMSTPDSIGNRDENGCARLCLSAISIHALMLLMSSLNLISTAVDPAILVVISLTAIGTLVNKRLVLGTSSLFYAITCMTLSPTVLGNGEICLPLTALAAAITLICGILSIIGKQRIFGSGLIAFSVFLLTGTLSDISAITSAGFVVIAISSLATIITTDLKNDCVDSPHMAAPSSTGFMILSLALFTASIFGLSGIDPEAYSRILFVECVFVIAFSVISMRERMITETVVLILTGTFLMAIALSGLDSQSSIFLETNIFLCIGTLIAAFVYLTMKNVSRTAGCILLAICIGASALSSDAGPLFRLSAISAGVLFLLVSIKKTVRFGISGTAKIEDRYNLKQSDNQYSIVLVMTVSIILLLILALVSESGVLMSIDDPALNVFRALLIMIVLGFGIYAMYKGIAVAAIFMIASSGIALLGTVFPLFGFSLPIEIKLVSSLIFIPVIYCYLKVGDTVMFSISLLTMLSLSVDPFLERTDLFDIAVIFSKTVSALAAATLWIEYDTGKQIVPKISRLWRKDLIKEGAVRSNQQCILTCAISVASLILMWAGLAVFSNYDDIIPFEMSMAVMSVLLIIICAFLFRTGSVIHGSLFLTISACMLGCALPLILGFTMESSWIVILLFVPSIVLSLHAGLRGTTIITVMIAASFAALLLGLPDVWSGLLFLISGATLLIWLGYRMVVGTPEFRPTGNLTVATMMITGMFGILTAVPDSGNLSIPAMILSIFTCIVAIQMGHDGKTVGALILLAVSVPALTYGPLIIAETDVSPIPILFMATFVFAAAAISIIDRRGIVSGMCILSGAMMTVSALLGNPVSSSAGFALISMLVLATGLMKMFETTETSPVASI